MKESQEGNKPKEQQEDLSNEFSRISQAPILKQWEAKNREKLSESSLLVRDAFDKLWSKLTGRPYYQPVTTVSSVTAPQERIDPKSKNYRALVRFDKIMWLKIPRRKIGKVFKDLYNLKGVESGTGDERPIFNNLDTDRIEVLFGVKAKDKIIADSKSMTYGEISEPFEVLAEGYWEVIFSPQQHSQSKKKVEILWEGQCLIVERMQPVVIPGFYLEAADNAVLDKYAEDPQLGRRKVASILENPYTTLREATRQEFLAQKAKGDAVLRAKIMREENV